MKKNQKNVVIAVVIFAILAIATAFSLVYINDQNKNNDNETAQTETIDKSIFSNGGKQIDYSGEDDKTALDVLKGLTSVDSKESSYGTMVTGINSVSAEDGKSYWAFYVNGSYANEGAATYKTKSTDKITWKLEEIK